MVYVNITCLVHLTIHIKTNCITLLIDDAKVTRLVFMVKSKLLTKHCKDKSVGKMSVKGQLHHISAKSQCAHCLNETSKDVSKVKEIKLG